ncbi:MAG: ABC transporter permease subunit [Firmicutes bacterium]|nr:ABC transporter permease subunit [Bacillota bacterium]
MNKLATAFLVESKKLFRSKVPLVSLLASLMIPFVGGLFMFILKDPELAQKMGVISAKAHIMGTADWPSYLGLLSQAIAVGGLFIFGFITSWVFGREYSDRTINDLLALPISRGAIVMGKFLVVGLWSLSLSVVVIVLGFIVGRIVDIPQWSTAIAGEGLLTFLLCAILTLFLSTPVALLASIGRGYLSPLGFIVFTLVTAQVVAVTGYGWYFPWSVPALLSQTVGQGSMAVEPLGIHILLVTGLVGMGATVCWWRYADHK